MSTEKPTRVHNCRACQQEFKVELRGQQYCNACRQARAEALDALRIKVCGRCKVERDNCSRGFCPDCRQEIAQAKKDAENSRVAAKLERINANGGCKHCGKPATRPEPALCADCYLAYCQRERKEIQDKRRAADQKRWEEMKPKSQPTHEDDGKLSEAEEFAAGLLMFIGLWLNNHKSKPGKGEVPKSKEVSPEQVDADDQFAIDAAFRTLMEGLEL